MHHYTVSLFIVKNFIRILSGDFKVLSLKFNIFNFKSGSSTVPSRLLKSSHLKISFSIACRYKSLLRIVHGTPRQTVFASLSRIRKCNSVLSNQTYWSKEFSRFLTAVHSDPSETISTESWRSLNIIFLQSCVRPVNIQ